MRTGTLPQLTHPDNRNRFAAACDAVQQSGSLCSGLPHRAYGYVSQFGITSTVMCGACYAMPMILLVRMKNLRNEVMSALKSFAWVGVLACLMSCGCGGSGASSTTEKAPDVMPEEATDPSALMGGDLDAESGNAGGNAGGETAAP